MLGKNQISQRNEKALNFLKVQYNPNKKGVNVAKKCVETVRTVGHKSNAAALDLGEEVQTTTRKKILLSKEQK